LRELITRELRRAARRDRRRNTIPDRSGPGSAFPVGSGRTTVQEPNLDSLSSQKLGEGSDELDRSVFVKLMTGIQHVEFAIGNTPCHGRQFVAWEAAVGAGQYRCWSGDRSQVAPRRAGTVGQRRIASGQILVGRVRRTGHRVGFAAPGICRSAVVNAKLGIVGTAYMVKALDESTWPAFSALVEFNNGVFGGCWSMGFHADGVGKGTTAAVNCERKLSRVRAATAHAALVFDGDDCLGWCQFGVPDEVPRIKSRAAYEHGLTTPPDWRIACCYVGKGHRRQGVATAGLAGALELIAGQGGGRVEGYPEDAGSVPAGFLYNGALSTYENLGFSRDRRIGKHRWVVTKVVEPSS